jgi:hypothetical protein
MINTLNSGKKINFIINPGNWCFSIRHYLKIMYIIRFMFRYSQYLCLRICFHAWSLSINNFILLLIILVTFIST